VLAGHADVLAKMGRMEEAVALHRRALAIDEKARGPDHPVVAVTLNNLALLLLHTKQTTEAESLFRRSLAIDERFYGPDHPRVAPLLHNLAHVEEQTKGVAPAEALLRRAIAIGEKAHGPDHPTLSASLSNLALLLYRAGRHDEVEPLMRRALFINKATYGPADLRVAENLVELAAMRAQQGDWVQAAALHAHAKPALIAQGGAGDRPDLVKTILKRHSDWVRHHAVALNRADARSATARAEGFELAQWALQTDAAEALTQMSARFSKGDGRLATLVRERDGLIARRRSEEARMSEATAKNDAQALKALYASKDEIGEQFKRLDAELEGKFADYTSLANPKPLTVAETQALLQPDEALVLFLDGPKLTRLSQPPEAMLVWVVAKTKVTWHRVPLDAAALADSVMALRCGLDDSRWNDDESSRECRHALKASPYQEEVNGEKLRVLPFDLARSHALYKALLGPAEALIKDKHLLIVASGPLTSLPFSVLVTAPPKAPGPVTLAGYRKAAWLGTRQPISLLPSVASLSALRRHARTSQAALPFVGFGDPALTGDCGASVVPDRCPDEQIQVARSAHVLTRGTRSPAAVGNYFRNGSADVAALKENCPLPDTAYELRCVARSLGAAPSVVVLGKEMTETTVKSAALERYRIVHFATHGLLAGETEQYANARAEPALLMSPPAEATEEDDGLLTASEVARLKLDADWVVLSACNTAGGKEPGAEALSGLARAFFYAGARALLVSHWYVNSYAATMLTSRTFAEMRDSRIGRSEAFRRSMLALLGDETRSWAAHPSIWAPFVVVGEGAPVQPPTAKGRGQSARASDTRG
jgi:CHAT domain-containing protein/Tfp pilus assembly protein PilF